MLFRSPDVVETSPRLPDGTPFPTLFYLTCPRAAAAIGSLEASGLMREMTQRISDDTEDLAPTEKLIRRGVQSLRTSELLALLVEIGAQGDRTVVLMVHEPTHLVEVAGVSQVRHERHLASFLVLSCGCSWFWLPHEAWRRHVSGQAEALDLPR